jgi:hypothetical protein
VSIQKQRSSLNQGIKFECNQPQNATGFYSVTPATPELLQLLRYPPNVIFF